MIVRSLLIRSSDRDALQAGVFLGEQGPCFFERFGSAVAA